MVKNIIVIDAETTGLDAKSDEILQLAILSENGDVLFNEYIKPQNHDSWPDSEKIHHISPTMVEGALALSSYKNKLQRIIDNADVIVGYNHSFDMAFLESAGIHSDPKKNYDLMLEFSQLKGDWDEKHNNYKWYKLKECADYFGYEWAGDSTHDALADAKATLYCYNKIIGGQTGEDGAKNIKKHPSAFAMSNLGTIKKNKRNYLIPVFALVIATLALVFFGVFRPKKNSIKVVTTSSLVKVLNASDLSTVEYSYSSVTQAVDKKGKPRYYVTYDGTVKAGINFDDIAKSIQIDEANQKVIVTIPEVKIQSMNVDVTSLDFIFLNNKDNKSKVTQEAQKLCTTDLKNELDNNPRFMEIARENAVSTVRQLIEPWLKQVDSGYSVEVR